VATEFDRGLLPPAAAASSAPLQLPSVSRSLLESAVLPVSDLLVRSEEPSRMLLAARIKASGLFSYSFMPETL
jgi:hypothetical protein